MKQGKRGFTLLEVMVAAALVAILGAAIATLVGRGIQAWRKTDDRLHRLFLVEKAMNRLGKDLRNGLCLADRPFLGSRTLQGSGSELLFATAKGPTHLAQVHYLLRPDGKAHALIREWQPFPAKEPGALQAKVIASGVKSFSVEYGSLKKTKDVQPQLNWTQAWDASQQPLEVPKLLRVRIEMEAPQGGLTSVTREFLLPHGVLHRSPSNE